MFTNILDKKRRDLLPLLASFKSDFYLAGGTALALQLGHRDSVDFDFFTTKNIDTQALFFSLKSVFRGHSLLKVQEEKNTLTVVVDEHIKLSFFTYPYPLIEKLLSTPYLHLASIADIGCMKLSAVTGRAANKDYIDLYFILKHIKLLALLENMPKKFPDIDLGLVLKSTIFFNDVIEEPIKFKNNNRVAFSTVTDFLEKEVKKALRTLRYF